jgi:hypothetical protein
MVVGGEMNDNEPQAPAKRGPYNPRQLKAA